MMTPQQVAGHILAEQGFIIVGSHVDDLGPGDFLPGVLRVSPPLVDEPQWLGYEKLVIIGTATIDEWREQCRRFGLDWIESNTVRYPVRYKVKAE